MASKSELMFDAARPKLSALLESRGYTPWQIDIVQLSIKHFDYDESKGPLMETALFPAQSLGPCTTQSYGLDKPWGAHVAVTFSVTNAVMRLQLTPAQAAMLHTSSHHRVSGFPSHWRNTWVRHQQICRGESAEEIIANRDYIFVDEIVKKICFLVGIFKVQEFEVKKV